MTTEIIQKTESLDTALAYRSATALSLLAAKEQGLVMRMFTDPHLLEKEERLDVVRALREAVAANPRSSDLRVVLGMALCVNFEVQDAIEELQESVRLAPGSFIAQLKMGELWMRLRVCEKAESHTRQAALEASNSFQAELARRQAANIRALMHNGVMRGGSTHRRPWYLLAHLRRLWKRDERGVDVQPALEAQ